MSKEQNEDESNNSNNNHDNLNNHSDEHFHTNQNQNENENKKEPKAQSHEDNNQIPFIFAGKNFYEIFEIEKSATKEQIKKAYRKIALKLHPDRNHSPSSTAEFQYVGLVHEVLTNEQSKAFYDRHGYPPNTHYHNNDNDNNDNDNHASNSSYDQYFRSVFPKFTTKDLDDYEKEYIGSNEEMEDIKHFAIKYNYQLHTIMDCIPFSSSVSVRRIAEALENLSNGTVKFSEKKINSIIRKMQKQEATQLKHFNKQNKNNLIQFNNHENENNNNSESLSLSHLVKQISAKELKKKMDNIINKIETKYKDDSHNNNEGEAFPSEEEFRRIQENLLKRKKK